MPTYIIRLDDEQTNRPYYLEWSTIVDAPTTYGMTLEQFTDHYRERYGSDGVHGLSARLERVAKHGSSCAWEAQSAEDMISGNRAGPDETELTREQIIEEYCRRPETKP